MAQISSSSQQNMCPRVLLSPCTTSPTQLSSTTMTKTITNANGRIRAKNEEENKRSGNGYKERDEGRTEGRKGGTKGGGIKRGRWRWSGGGRTEASQGPDARAGIIGHRRVSRGQKQITLRMSLQESQEIEIPQS